MIRRPRPRSSSSLPRTLPNLQRRPRRTRRPLRHRPLRLRHLPPHRHPPPRRHPLRPPPPRRPQQGRPPRPQRARRRLSLAYSETLMARAALLRRHCPDSPPTRRSSDPALRESEAGESEAGESEFGGSGFGGPRFGGSGSGHSSRARRPTTVLKTSASLPKVSASSRFVRMTDFPSNHVGYPQLPEMS